MDNPANTTDDTGVEYEGYTAFVAGYGMRALKLDGAVREALDAVNKLAQSGDAPNIKQWYEDKGVENVTFLAAFADKAREAKMDYHDINMALEQMVLHINNGTSIADLPALANDKRDVVGGANTSSIRRGPHRIPAKQDEGEFAVPLDQTSGKGMRTLIQEALDAPKEKYLQPEKYQDFLRKQAAGQASGKGI